MQTHIIRDTRDMRQNQESVFTEVTDKCRCGDRKRKKKRIKLKRVGEKSLLRGKSTEELMGEAYNYQGNGDMGSPLTQEKKREMLDLPGKHS